MIRAAIYTGRVYKCSSVSEILEFVSRPHSPSDTYVLLSASADMDSDIELQSYWEDPYINDNDDYDSGAAPLWSLYAKVAKEDDKANLDSVTNDMTTLLVFVRPPSSALPLLCTSSY